MRSNPTIMLRRPMVAVGSVSLILALSACSTTQDKHSETAVAASVTALEKQRCEAWDQSGGAKARVPLNLTPDRTTLSGQTQGDVVRYLVEARGGKLYLGLYHRTRNVGVSHGFDFQDSHIELTLTADDPTGKVPSSAYVVACRP